MKRILALALAGSMLAGLAGCGGKDSGTASGTPPAGNKGGNTSVSEPAKTPGPAPAGNGLDASNIALNPLSKFEDGLALISFYDKESKQSYAGLIDRGGSLQSYAMMSGDGNAEYVDGYVYIYSSDAVYVLDKNFNILTSHPLDAEINETFITCGAGFFITRELKSGFEKSEVILHVFDSAGKEVNSFTPSNLRDEDDASYVGNGVFYIGEFRGGLYFSKSNVWLDGLNLSNQGIDGIFDREVLYFRFYDDLLVYYVDRDKPQFSYTDDKGNTETITIPEEYTDVPPTFVGATEGTMLFAALTWSAQLTLFTYNVQTGQFQKYQGNYADRILETLGLWPQCGEGLFAFAVPGADGQLYSMLLNENLEQICEPVLGGPASIENGRFYARIGSNEQYVSYDLQGNDPQPIALTSGLMDFDDEVAIYDKRYINFDDTPIEIDYSTGKLVTLPG